MDIAGGKPNIQANMQIQGMMPGFQFCPQTAECVKQNINISQNIYLSPQILLLLSENENGPIYQAASPNV